MKSIGRLVCLGVVLVCLPLAACKIVPIETEKAQEAAQFNAADYAAGLWSTQALPYFTKNARPSAEVLAALGSDLENAGMKFGNRQGEGSPWSFIVSGEGVVAAKNTESRAGTMVIALDGGTDATLQIGPVLRGNTVRDALPFVSFKDFTNQIEYANAGKALTALALEGFEPSAKTIAVGDRVKFTGTIGMSKASDKPLITPVLLDKVGS